jgi:hypothetical protein
LGTIVLIDFRPHAKLRGKNAVDFCSAVSPVIEALTATTVDLSLVRIVCDWVQYRENFREVVDVRPLLPYAGPSGKQDQWPPATGAPNCGMEIAVDVRRSPSAALGDLLTAKLSRRPPGPEGAGNRIYLEDWAPGSESCIWDFNALYWSALELWEKASGRSYEQALPGGESDARNRDAARELISELFEVWDGLALARALPEELFVAELGVGNGSQAKVFLDEFRELDRAGGRDYYRRLHYLMCDYSPYVLSLARETVITHASHVSSVPLDATHPSTSLGFLRGRAFLLYISNVYDNLATDEVAQFGGQPYCVHTRAYFPPDAAAELAASVSATPEQLPALTHRLLRLGPALLPEAVPHHVGNVEAAVLFWQQAWSALRLEERYVPLAGLDQYSLAFQVSGEELRPLLESGSDVRMHVSNGAAGSFTDSLPLLHPLGKLVCHDLFVTEVQDYRAGFRGPGKYDGSVVNWVNGPLLAHVGRRRGFDVRYTPFRHRSGGHIMTMTAQPAD